MTLLAFKPNSSANMPPVTCEDSLDRNIAYGHPKTIYKDITIIKPLDQAKFSVFLAQSNITKKKYAVKVFPYEFDNANLYYINESRFACFKHPNIINYLHREQKQEAELEEGHSKISYLVMEYCPRGDFITFINQFPQHIDDKLARTYFVQLIEGLEYIHANGVAHMDLKLPNLLISDDGQLKIIDFDLAICDDDIIMISGGTRLYRAPEVKRNKCVQPKIADIYSAGVLLFLLKSRGVFPFFEKDSMNDTEVDNSLERDPQRFWSAHSSVQKQGPGFFDEDFQDLFNSMTRTNTEKRATIQDIKNSKWYNKPVYSPKELKEKINSLYNEKKAE